MQEGGFARDNPQKAFLLSDVPKQKWENLAYFDKVLSRNQIALKDFDEEVDATPFFLDFGHSLLQQMKDELEGKFVQSKNKESKILKKREDNEFLDEAVDRLEQILQNIPSFLPEKGVPDAQTENLFHELFELLKSLSSFELDHFIKRQTAFDSDNCVRLLRVFHFCFSHSPADFDFKCALLKAFLEAAADQLLQLKGKSPLTVSLLSSISKVLTNCLDHNEEVFLEVKVVLESISNQTRDFST